MSSLGNAIKVTSPNPTHVGDGIRFSCGYLPGPCSLYAPACAVQEDLEQHGRTNVTLLDPSGNLKPALAAQDNFELYYLPI